MNFSFVFLFFIFFSCSHGNSFTLSDHYDGERFYNPKGPGTKSFFQLLKWKWSAEPAEWPKEVKTTDYSLPIFNSHSKAIVTFINHASFFIQLSGVNLLTDPIFSERAGPFESFGPVKRVRPPGKKIADLSKVDVVLISHNHYDHLDLEDLLEIDQKFKPLFLVPLGDKELLKKKGIQNIKELDWWDEIEINKMKITFTPVQHWSARGLFDKNKSLWGGYYLTHKDVKIYFAGDTGYTRFFAETRLKLGSPDLSLLPIGAYAPRWFMKDFHMEPEEAVKAHMDLESKVSIGMHFGTFKLSDEAFDGPVKELSKALTKQKVLPQFFKTLDVGESYIIQ